MGEANQLYETALLLTFKNKFLVLLKNKFPDDPDLAELERLIEIWENQSATLPPSDSYGEALYFQKLQEFKTQLLAKMRETTEKKAKEQDDGIKPLPDSLRKQIEYVKKDPNSPIVTGQFGLLFFDSQITNRYLVVSRGDREIYYAEDILRLGFEKISEKYDQVKSLIGNALDENEHSLTLTAICSVDL